MKHWELPYWLFSVLASVGIGFIAMINNDYSIISLFAAVFIGIAIFGFGFLFIKILQSDCKFMVL